MLTRLCVTAVKVPFHQTVAIPLHDEGMNTQDTGSDFMGGFVVDELACTRRHLRIAVVTETWPPEVNGVALTLSRLVEGLRSRDHTLQLIRPRQPAETGGAALAPASAGQDAMDLLTGGVPIPRYPHMRMGLPATRGLIKRWSLQRPDVVHIATEGPLGWSAVRAAQRLMLPTVSDFRTNFHDYSRHYGVGWLRKPIVAYLRKFHNRTVCTTVPTHQLKAQLEASGFERLQVIPRGVDLQRFNPCHRSAALRSRWGADDDMPVMLCVSRLAAEKSLLELVDAYRAARSEGIRCKLVMVGDGPMLPELQARCPEAHFAGLQRGLDLSRHYASADLFAFPSQTETFGNVVIEAMASGVAVVAYRHAAAGEWLQHGHSAWLAEPGHALDLRKQVLRALVSPADRHSRAESARAIAHELDWPQVVDQFEGVLADAAASAAAPRLAQRAHSQPEPSANVAPRPVSSTTLSSPTRSPSA
jgi:glycosyltransferase involved in cell wall biosynthesis